MRRPFWMLAAPAACVSALAFAASAPAQAQVAQEPRVALVVGVSDYTDIGDLRNAVNDARAISATLDALEFDVLLLEDPDQTSFEVAVMEFSQRMRDAGPDALALFFFAGHGVQHDGVNYMLPGDISIDGPGLLERRGIEASWVMGVMDEAGVAAKVMVLDACRDNPFGDAWESETRSGLARGLAEMARPSGSVIMFSTSPGSVALDGEGDNSPFTAALVEEVQRPGVLLETTFKNIVRSVGERTEERQAPYLEGSFTGDFYLGGPPAPGGETAPEPTDTDDWYWSVVSASNEADDYRSYLETFPEGRHVEEAEQRLALLAALDDTPTEDPLTLARVSLTSQRASYSGRCPTTISFTGAIETSGGPGAVSYRFVRSDGAKSPIETLAVTEAGAQDVSFSWTLGPAEPFSGSVRLEVVEPQAVTSDPAEFTVSCATPVPSGSLRIDPKYVGQISELATTRRTGRDLVTGAVPSRPVAVDLSAVARLTTGATFGGAAPSQVSPEDGAVFSISPRTMTLSWQPVPGAAKYMVEVDAFGACTAGRFCSDVDGATQITDAGGALNTQVTFVGAQPGRWRVWAVDAAGKTGRKSPWREFLHKR